MDMVLGFMVSKQPLYWDFRIDFSSGGGFVVVVTEKAQVSSTLYVKKVCSMVT